MLRNIKSDLDGKYYAAKAREVALYDEPLLELLKQALMKKDKKIAGAIRSVVKTRNEVIIRAQSRPAMSELYTASSLILSVLKSEGVKSVRFTV